MLNLSQITIDTIIPVLNKMSCDKNVVFLYALDATMAITMMYETHPTNIPIILMIFAIFENFCAVKMFSSNIVRMQKNNAAIPTIRFMQSI